MYVYSTYVCTYELYVCNVCMYVYGYVCICMYVVCSYAFAIPYPVERLERFIRTPLC